MTKRIKTFRAWHPALTNVVLMTVALGVISSGATGITFSVDFQGPTAGGTPGPFSGVAASFGGVSIDEGSILTTAVGGPPGPNLPAFGPLAAPGVMVTAVATGSGTVPGGLGLLTAGGAEVDALSYGRDRGRTLMFSIDEFAVGGNGGSSPGPLDEGANNHREASADVFAHVGPIPNGVWSGPPIGSVASIDGNGLVPPVTNPPGLGLIEPNPPQGVLPDQGDNLDAVDVNTTLADVQGFIFFSMDTQFADPLEPTPPVNSGTAATNGFSGGDVVVTTVGAAPTLYAGANQLGLDLKGTDTDDLDALALRDDGVLNALGLPSFNPQTDSILFSVRRSSSVIGQIDSRLGIGIEEGDVLTIPTVAGGTPAILVPAEWLGLATVRTNFVNFGDDLDAIDRIPEPATLGLVVLGGLAGLTRRRK